MHVALVGDDPEGVELACALADSGRHTLAAHTADVSAAVRRRWGDARQVRDLEELLADPAIDAVIVAGPPAYRAAQLRRALQAERHVLCVHPPGPGPEAAYEAGMVRDDTGRVLLPVLPLLPHPALARLAEFARPGDKPSPVGSFVALEGEWSARDEVLLPGDPTAGKPAFPGWEMLRVVGGEIHEVWAYAETEEVETAQPVLLAGRFADGGLFRLTLLPRQPADRLSLTVVGSAGRAELLFPAGRDGPAYLAWEEGGESFEEPWPRWDPWPALVEAFEEALNGKPVRPAWEDTVRALELDDAARRSVTRRRASVLEYPEATEEASFKGTMTLVGCGMLWAVLMLLFLSVWLPRIRWLIVPLLGVFLVFQLLRYVIPERKVPPAEGEGEGTG